MWEITLFVLLPLLVYLSGTISERNHYRSLAHRERHLANLPVFDDAHTLSTLYPPTTSKLVMGSVVISFDIFRRVMAGLANCLLGRVESYDALLDRARREAVLRMKSEAATLDAALVCNVRLETAHVFPGWRGAPRAVEVLAYGTALVPIARTRSVTSASGPLEALARRPLAGPTARPALNP